MPGRVDVQQDAAPAVQPNVADIRARLGKKSTFEGAAAELTSVLLRRARCRQLDAAHSTTRLDIEAWETVQRTFALLRSRYTAPAFWRAGRMLFQAAVAAAANRAQLDAARSYLAATEDHLLETEARPATALSSAMPTGSSYLFEGQLGQEPPPRTLGIEDVLSLLVNSGAAETTRPAQASESDAGEGVHPGDAALQAAQPPEDRARALEQLFEHFRDAFGGENAAGLEEALRASLEDDGAHPGPPPAAKTAVKALAKEHLTSERLQELGADVQCSVCREELAVGEEVQLMPCDSGHVFHTPCLAPWLEQNNSCPVCRFELPTDDMEYEKQKQRAALEAEERRGADNALSHNEFMFM